MDNRMSIIIKIHLYTILHKSQTIDCIILHTFSVLVRSSAPNGWGLATCIYMGCIDPT